MPRTSSDARTAADAHDPPRPELTAAQQREILRATSRLVQGAVLRQPPHVDDTGLEGAAEIPVMGCFVSIKRKGKLRGCCGFLGRRSSLWQALQESAVTSATGDIRMPSIVADELAHLSFEVWLLYGQQPILLSGEDRQRAVEIGRHGLHIHHGASRGLLLPGVATEHGFDAPTFLQQVCLKAGLPAQAWQDDQATLSTFEGLVVRGDFEVPDLQAAPQPALRFSVDEIERLAVFCSENIVAVSRGAVPTYYLPSVSDGAVQGLSITVRVASRPDPLQVTQVGLRHSLPLQSTLFQISQAAGQQLTAHGIQPHPHDVQVGLTVLYEPAMQGTAEAPDWDGFDPHRRALLVAQENRSAWRFDPQQTASQLLETILSAAEIQPSRPAVLYSFVAQASQAPVQVVTVPVSAPGADVRPPAVADRFYPGDAQQLRRMLDQLTPTEVAEREKWHAALVPHAGLIYSGRIAADVLRRIEMPKSIIVIGPKHTRLGLNWAVAPHQRWSLPGIDLASDRELAEALCQAIDGLQLDAAAHQQEHAIEVELPWLARLAPQSKVVGIVVGQADFAQCRQFASGLAAVLEARGDDTLLVISSDMNHFANDVETRRVDALAIAAMEALDAERLYRTVRDNQISMCGMLPACIVLDCLRQMGRLRESQTVAYGTSADVSGDTSRVVGYAGMLFRG